MRHQIKKKHLSRTSAQRKALFRGLAISLFEHGKLETTLAKAKAGRPFVERLITIAKKNNLAARRLLLSHLYQKREMVKKLIEEIGPKYAKRPGGYLRIVKLDERQGDGAEMARVELVGESIKIKKVDENNDKKSEVKNKKEISNVKSQKSKSATLASFGRVHVKT